MSRPGLWPEADRRRAIDALLDEVIAREGGFVHHRADRGGPTKFGITQAILSEWLGRPATVDEVRVLDEETAREIYVARYFAVPRIDTLPPEIVPQVFDIAVNHGPRRAVRLLQEVLNLAGWRVDVDGIIGPETRRAAFEAQAEMGPFLTNAVADQRANYYRSIVAADLSQRVFLRGWLARADGFKVPTPNLTDAATGKKEEIA